MDINRVEWHFIHEVETHHHHPRDPKEDNVEPRHQYVSGVVTLKFGSIFWPT